METSPERFITIVNRIVEVKELEAQERMIDGAFIGWQIQEQLKAFSDKTREQSFNDYIKAMGLDKTPKERKEKKPFNKDEALKEALDIIALDTQRPKGG